MRVFHFVRQVLQRSGFEARLGPDHMWHSMTAGVRAARARAKQARGDLPESAEDDDLGGYNAGEERIAVGVDPHLFETLGESESAK